MSKSSLDRYCKQQNNIRCQSNVNTNTNVTRIFLNNTGITFSIYLYLAQAHNNGCVNKQCTSNSNPYLSDPICKRYADVIVLKIAFKKYYRSFILIQMHDKTINAHDLGDICPFC